MQPLIIEASEGSGLGTDCGSQRLISLIGLFHTPSGLSSSKQQQAGWIDPAEIRTVVDSFGENELMSPSCCSHLSSVCVEGEMLVPLKAQQLNRIGQKKFY